MTAARTQLDLAMTEAALQDAAIDLAALTGKWLIHHSPKVQTVGGDWYTPTVGHRGFTDVVFLSSHFRLLVFAEFKTEKGRLGVGQPEWGEALELMAFNLGPDFLYRVWRPSHWPEIEHVLTKGCLP